MFLIIILTFPPWCLAPCRASPPGRRRTRSTVSRLWWTVTAPKPTGPESWTAMSSYWWAHNNDSLFHWKPLNRLLLRREKKTPFFTKTKALKFSRLINSHFRPLLVSTKRRQKIISKMLFEVQRESTSWWVAHLYGLSVMCLVLMETWKTSDALRWDFRAATVPCLRNG